MQPRKRVPLGDIANTISCNQSIPSKDQIRKPTPLPTSPRLDERHRSNPLYPVDYIKDIFDHFRRTETRFRPVAPYMGRQTDINERMRTILVDWLVDVHLKFKLTPETLHLAVDIIDRFLALKVVTRQKLQLVGVVAMFIGAKYEEIYPPEVKDFIYISANTYTREEILRMERLMLSTLDFNLTVPTAYPFVKRALQVVDADATHSQLANYICELSLMDLKVLGYLPSTIGASCVFLARRFLNIPDAWNRTLEHYTQFKQIDLELCARDLMELLRTLPNQRCQAIRKKYSHPRYGEVAGLVVDDMVV